MTWITNSQLNDLKEEINILVSQVEYKQRMINGLADKRDEYYRKYTELLQQPPKTVIKKDPNGFIQADIKKIKLFMDSKPYKVGDTIDLVAYKAGQRALLDTIVSKLIAPKAKGVL